MAESEEFTGTSNPENEGFAGASNPLVDPIPDSAHNEDDQSEPVQPPDENTSPVGSPDGGFVGASSALGTPPPESHDPPSESHDPQDSPPSDKPGEVPAAAGPVPVEQPDRSPSPPPVAKPEPHQTSLKPSQQPPKTQSAEPARGPPPPTDGPHDRKARDFIAQADKLYKSSQGFFSKLFGGSTKKEEAADMYVRAANAYKVGKRYQAAGECFRRAAEIHVELDVKHEAASSLVEAGQVLKKEAPREATVCYLKAVEIYTDMGRFSMAARYHNNVAEIFENEVQDYEEAITHYEQAADFYKGEDSTASANKALLKVAHMCATLQKFKKAADLFEEIGKQSLGNNLLKYAAKDYFFKACLCHFAISPGNARDATIRYTQLHPGFDGTREIKLIRDLLTATDDEDPDKFAILVEDYDSISRVDAWTTAVLLHIKKAITAAPDYN